MSVRCRARKSGVTLGRRLSGPCTDLWTIPSETRERVRSRRAATSRVDRRLRLRDGTHSLPRRTVQRWDMPGPGNARASQPTRGVSSPAFARLGIEERHRPADDGRIIQGRSPRGCLAVPTERRRPPSCDTCSMAHHRRSPSCRGRRAVGSHVISPDAWASNRPGLAPTRFLTARRTSPWTRACRGRTCMSSSRCRHQ